MKIIPKAKVPAVLALLLCLMVVESAWSGGCRPQWPDFVPENDFPQAYSDLEPDPAVVWGQFENGFRYVLLENQRPEKRVHVHLMVEAGSFHEKASQRGLAHFLEHLLFCGTEHFPPGELIKYFQDIGMRFGNDANARTGFFRTVYDLHLPSGDRESLQKGLLVMQDYARGALIPEAEVDRERAVILAEKRTRDSVGYRTYKAALNFELAGARVTERLPIGLEKVIKEAGSDDLRLFYDTWYRPERLILVMVGDFDTAVAEKLLAEKFSGLAPRAPAQPVPDFGQVRHQGLSAFYHYEEEAGDTEVVLETIRQEPRPHDSLERVQQELIRNLAYRIVNYRLDALEESRQPPFLSASSGAGRVFREIVYSSISASCVPENWSQALEGIEQTLRQALLHGFTAAEVARVKKEVLASLDRAVKQAATRESGFLAAQLQGCLARDRVFQSPAQDRQLLAPVVEAVTPEQLHQALRTSWPEENRLILVTGKVAITEKTGRPEERILSVYKRSQEEAVSPPEEAEALQFPYLPAPPPGEIVNRDYLKEIGVGRVTFASQVRLNYKKTDFKANQVIARVVFGAGESAEPSDQPALCELGTAVVNQSGFGKMKKEDVNRALAGKKAGIRFSVSPENFILKGQCASDELELLFQLFYTFFMDFGCRQEAYQQSLERFEQHYEELQHTISGAMTLEGYRFLAGGDTRIGMPAGYDRFSAVSLADIRDWVYQAVSQSVPEISVVGDFDEKSLIQAAAAYFGQKLFPPVPAPPSPERAGPDFPEGESCRLVVPTEIKKGLVDVCWPTDDFWDIHQTRRFSVLSDVITERMRQGIREEAGHSYSQYAYNDPSRAYPEYGVFHAVARIAPEAAEEVTSRIRAIIADIAENGVTAAELRRAKDPILTHIRQRVETNGYWLNSVLSGSTAHPEMLDWCRTFLSDYQAITVEEMNRLARRYFHNAESARVVIVPAEAAADKRDR